MSYYVSILVDYNSKVIATPAQTPNLNPKGKFVVHLEKNWEKISENGKCN